MRTESLFRYFGFITLMLASLSIASQAFALEDRAWNVETHVGTVWVKHAALQPVALNPNESLRAGSTIETGEDGRVVLVRGDESIIVSPRTSLALPEHSDNGMATTILQSFGTILLQVEKRAKQHFEVETPFLAAVVKGTKFTVTVDQSGAAVHVVEGAVEVIDLDTGDVGMVRPGQTAHTPAAQGVGLSVGGPGAVAPARAAAPARTNKTVPAPRQTEAAAPVKAPAPIVVASVGTAALDVGVATNGLARAATVSNGAVSSAGSSTDQTTTAAENGAAAGEAAQATVATAGASGNVPPGLVGNTNAVAAGLTDSGGGTSGTSGTTTAALASNSAPGLADNSNANAGGNSAAAASNGLSVGNSGATPPGLSQSSSSNAGGNGNGVAAGLTNSTPPGLANNPSASSGNSGNGNGLAVGQTGATPPGLVNNPNSNAGGNGNGLAIGQTGETPPGLANNPNSNAGGNGNGNANSNAGGNGKGNGKA
eukprot:s1_g1076.t1